MHQEREIELMAEVEEGKRHSQDLQHQLNALKGALEQIKKMVSKHQWHHESQPRWERCFYSAGGLKAEEL